MLNNLSPAPFWFLNHRLEKAEILRQLKLMKDCGVSGFFMHSRAGLLTPYGSDSWLKIIHFIVEEAEKLNLKAWLYDEDPFPSGAAGGQILMEHPEFTAHEIITVEIKPDKSGVFSAKLGSHPLLAAVAVKTDESGKIIEERDVSSATGIIRDQWFGSAWNNSYFAKMTDDIEFPHYRAETFYPQQCIELNLDEPGWTVYCSLAAIIPNSGKYGRNQDNLNPDCVRRFIELTHEKYAKVLGKYFGTTIPGIFTDEPSCGASPPWTPALSEEFFNDHGYGLKTKLYHLHADFSDVGRQFREDYWQTVNRLYKNNFFGQISKWCKEHNLMLCGHVPGEETPMNQAVSGGSAFDYQNYFDIPGFDHITPNIGSHEYPALNFGGRFIASAARIHGHNLVLSECFGCNAFNFGFDGMRKVADWLFSLGINFLVPHGFYYSYDGMRKNDAGKSFFFQDPEFPLFKGFSVYAGNICRKLSTGQIASDVCLINPSRRFRQLMPCEIKNATELSDSLYRASQFLMENHYCFIIVDDDQLLNTPELATGFKAVVVPDEYTEELPFKTITANSEALQQAGVVPLPVAKFAQGAETGDLISLVKNTENGQTVYLYNNSPQAGYFHLGAVSVLYDGITDTYYRLNDGKFAIPGYTGVLLLTGDNGEDIPSYTLLEENLPVKSFAFDTNPEWEYVPPCHVVRALLHWDINAGNMAFKNQRFCLLRNLTGTEFPHLLENQVRPIFDTVPKQPSLYPMPLKFTAQFSLEEIKEKLFLVIESDTVQGDCTIILNGTRIEQEYFTRAFFYDAFNLSADVSKLLNIGKNTLELEWNRADEFSGLTSAIYIMPSLTNKYN